jgi:hypothetical protein
MWEAVSTILILLGLLLTAVGAGIAAKAVIISDEQATRLAGPNLGGNNALADSLKAQSRRAKNGLRMILGGTILQIMGTALPLVIGRIIMTMTSLS